MPHQCLNCGEIFDDGSPYLLKGCPKCGGKRFFYIKKPLTDEERERIKKETEAKLEEKIAKIFQKNLEEIKPDDIRKFFMDISANKRKEALIIDDEEREKRIKDLLRGEKDKPETIVIEEPGRYKLDIKSLLEEEPIIIQKDGSYIIHLPSLFSMIDKERED